MVVTYLCIGVHCSYLVLRIILANRLDSGWFCWFCWFCFFAVWLLRGSVGGGVNYVGTVRALIASSGGVVSGVFVLSCFWNVRGGWGGRLY